MSKVAVKTRTSMAIDLAEFRQGWRVLVLALIGIGTSVSVAPLYAFGTMVVPMQEAFGWSRGEVQSSIAFLFASSVIAIQFTGWLNKRYGLRPVALVSLVTLPIGYLAMTLNTGSIIQLYAGYAMLAFAGLGTLQVTWTHFVNLWFDKNRGLALAIILCGTGLSGLVMPPLLTWAMELWGWRAGFWVLAILPVALTFPMSLFWLTSSGPVGHSRTSDANAAKAVALPGMLLPEVFRSRKFWLCNFALVFFVIAMIGMLTNAVPMMRDNGLSAGEAAATFSVYGISLVIGRFLVGYLIDRLWAPGVAFVVMFLPAIGCIIFFLVETYIPLLMLAAMLIGVGAGAEMDIAAFMMARYFGMRDYSRVFALHMGFISLGSTLAPILFAVMYDSTGSYAAMLTFCTISFAVSACLLLTMGRYPNFSPVPPSLVVAGQAVDSIDNAAVAGER